MCDIERFENEGGAMTYISKGHTIVQDDLTFIFKHRYIEVYGHPNLNLVGTIPVMDINGLPLVGTEQDMQEAIAWYLFDNNAL